MTRPSAAKARYSHIGICVTDLERSLTFYRNVFGFSDVGGLEVGNEVCSLSGMVGQDIHMRSRFMRMGSLLIELLRWNKPQAVGPGQPRPMNQLGLTHLSFNVDVLDPVLEAAERWGGTAMYDTRTDFAFPHMKGEIVFVTDPDGMRIELMAFPEDVKMG